MTLPIIKYYPEVAIVLEIFLGTVVISLCGLVFTGLCKLLSWRKPYGFMVMNILAADFINGVNSFLHAAYIHCLLKDVKAVALFRTVFFLQALFLWGSLLSMILFNFARLVVVILPFEYTRIISVKATRCILAAIWISGLIYHVTKSCLWSKFNRNYSLYVADVMIHIILNLIVIFLALYSIFALRYDASQESSQPRIRATKTVATVSIVFGFSYGYYIYVYIIWIIPNLPYDTTNEWIEFTAVGPWSLSIAHLFLLVSSLFNCIMFGLQPKTKRAIENIWVPNYYRTLLIQAEAT